MRAGDRRARRAAAPPAPAGRSGSAAMRFAGYVITGWVLTGVVHRRVLALDRAAHQARRAVVARRRGRVTTVASPPAPPLRAAAPDATRTRYIVAVGGCVVAVVAIVVLAVVLSDNVVYFRTVSEAVHDRADAGHVAVPPRRRASSAARSHETGTACASRSPTARTPSPSTTPATRPTCSRTARRSCARGTGRRTASNAPFESDRILIRHGADYSRRRSTPSKSSRVSEGRARVRARSRSGPARAVVGICALHRRAATARRAAPARRAPVRVRRARAPRSPRPGSWSGRCISHDFSIRYVAENNAARHAAAVHDHRAVGRARGVDPAVGADPRRLPHVRRAASSARRAARPAGRGRDDHRPRRRAVLLRADARARPTRSRRSAVAPLDGRGPEPAAAEPLAHGVPPADALPRATSGSRCRSCSRSPRSSPAASARAGWPTPAGRRSSRGASSPSASSSARGGATRCSGGAASGRGTRSRTRRCCPWLTGTAFIHSVIVQERRGMLRVWNLSLVIATFCLTILGTFLTRSGVIDSVHAFTQSDIGPWLLAFLGVVAATGIGLHRVARRPAARARAHRLAGVARVGVPRQQPAVRGARVRRAARHRVPADRRGAARAAGSRSGSRTSTAWPRRSGSRCCSSWRSAPALPWRATSGEVCGTGCWSRRGSARLTMVVAVVARRPRLAEVLAYGLGAFADRRDRAPVRARRARPPARAGRVARRRARTRDAVEPAALRRPRRALRRRADRGGARGVVGVRREPRGAAAARPVGDRRRATRSRTSARTPTRSAQKTTVSADVRVDAGRPRPRRRTRPRSPRIPNSTEGIGTPSVHTGLAEDVYLTLVSSPNAAGPRHARRARSTR